MSDVEDLDSVIHAVASGFGGRTVLVVGDLMLDRYLWGTANRISPEAPIPVLRLMDVSEAGGGAANVALNLSALGLKVQIFGMVGDDREGALLLEILETSGVSASGVCVVPSRPTTTKTRVMGAQKQMLRIDREIHDPAPAHFVKALLASVRTHMADAAALVLSDYAKGVLDVESCAVLISDARAVGVPVLVDSKATCFDRFLGATAITPNLEELSRVVGTSVERYVELVTEAHALRERLCLDHIVLTRGAQGMTLISTDGTKNFDATAREVVDVSGAGDTVVAVLAASLVGGLDVVDGLNLANLGAGSVVSRVGTQVLSRRDLMKAVLRSLRPTSSSKVHSWASIADVVRYWRSCGERVVFTNGCFDLLHAGHVTYLENAKSLGDRLVVGLNTDRSVRALKGAERPIVRESDRATVLAALGSVDAVVLFDDDTPLSLICAIQPDVLAKGADYSEEQVVGAREVRSWGGVVSLLPLVPGCSTSGLLAHILRHEGTEG